MKKIILTLCCLVASVVVWAEPPTRETLTWLREPNVWKLNLGSEFPGVTGSFETVESDGKTAGEITYKFTQKSHYIAAGIQRQIKDPFKELHLSFKATEPCKIMVRLFDAKGKTFQFLRDYDNTSDTSCYRIDIGNAQVIFGGNPPDKNFVFPLSGMWIGIERVSEKTTQGRAIFGEIELIR
jgi:hypothetical protein